MGAFHSNLNTKCQLDPIIKTFQKYNIVQIKTKTSTFSRQRPFATLISIEKCILKLQFEYVNILLTFLFIVNARKKSLKIPNGGFVFDH